jgi:hypothetical protein
MAVAFSLSALCSLDRPDDEAAALATELRGRGVAVPADWAEAYREDHLDAPAGAATPLPARVSAALRSRGVDPTAGEDTALRRATVAALDPAVETREGAPGAVEAAARRGPVGVLSAATVPERARRALIRAEFDRGRVDATVTAAGCGWRPGDARAVETLAATLGAEPAGLVCVTRDPAVADAAVAAGAEAAVVGADRDDAPADAERFASLSALASALERR